MSATGCGCGEGRTLGLCLIVRDESETIERCLLSVLAVVDEVLVIDTGSRDDTADKARRLGANVVRVRWSGSFASARNAALDRLGSDWVLMLDADEVLAAEDRDRVRELLSGCVEGYFLPVLSFLGGGEHDFTLDYRLSLFRLRHDYRFGQRLHEDISSAIVASRPDAALPIAPVRLLHYGYTDAVYRKKHKARRNRRLLLREIRETGRQGRLLYFLGIEELRGGRLRTGLDLLCESRSSMEPSAPQYRDVVRELAMAAIELGRLDLAASALEEGAARWPRYTDILFLQGVLAVARRNLEDAVCRFDDCLSLGEAPMGFASMAGVGSYRAYAAKATVLMMQEHLSEAYISYLKALALAPEWAALVSQIAALLAAMPPEEAARRVEQIRSLVGANVRRFAPSLWRSGRRDLAIRAEVPEQAPVAFLQLAQEIVSEGLVLAGEGQSNGRSSASRLNDQRRDGRI